MKRLIFLAFALLRLQSASAQHDMKGMKMDDTMASGTEMHMHDMGSMSHAYSLNLPMTRNGSGTGWLPDNSSMYGKMLHSGRWMFMLHGNLFIRYNSQDMFNNGGRGDSKVDAPNWLMLMGQRKVGRRGLFHFSTMFSLDALIAGGSGYPLLFQTGESWNGQPLVDRQHPHDLFSELSVSYSYALSKKADVFAYFGYPGEPALGSVAFMHRPSALTNPDAPISHHWNDGTHITFGVATIGFRYGKFKIEGSSFTGREPDENRYNFDMPKFDSWSGRLSFNPTMHWALQVSHGWVKSPEELHPNEDVDRTTASVVYSYSFSDNKLLNATALWGLNKTGAEQGENAVLLEASLALNRLNVYTRYEWVQKSPEELDLKYLAFYYNDANYSINAATLGISYDLLHAGALRVSAGMQATLYIPDIKLRSLYGNAPMGGEVYLRFYPTLIKRM
jgi:hypothetical protein